MTRPSGTCELYVNDVRVPDRAAQLLTGQPTALTGLSVTWGRDTANEQPGPATCEFVIRDESAASTFLDIMHVGSPVAVYSGGPIPGDSDGGDPAYVQTMDDGTFETWPLGAASSLRAAPTAASAAVTNETAGHALTLTRSSSTALPAVQLPPRTAVGVGGDPAAWDDIPKAVLNGATWELSARVWAPAGVTLTLRPVLYFNDQSATGTPQPAVAEISPAGDWATLVGTYQNTVGDAWLGVAVEAAAWDGYTWAEQPAGMEWQVKPGRWNDMSGIVRVDDVFIGRPAGATGYRRVLTFSGRVTDITAQPVGDLALEIKATAADLGAALGNNVIGDNPWPMQTAGARASRIAKLAGLPSTAVLFDAPLNALPVSFRDVDAQPAYPLLQDLAQTVGGVLWTATHTGSGAYLWIENTDKRASVVHFTYDAGTGLVKITTPTGGAADVLSACDLLRDPVTWRQDTADVSTVVAVTWLEQTVDDDGLPAPTERTVTITDSDAVAQYGTRRLSISTELTKSTDATQLANRALVEARLVGWRMDGLTLDTLAMAETLDSVDDATRASVFFDLLDGTLRMGLGVVLTDMPAYAPRGAVSAAYVEGGKYRYDDGAWLLELTVTPASGQGHSATWSEMDDAGAWQWRQFDPAIRWVDTYGVSV